MLKRVIHLSVTSLLFLPMYGCATGGEDDGAGTFGSFTTQGATFSTTNDTNSEEGESGDTTGDGDGDTGPGDGDGDGDTGPGDGDGDTNSGDGDGDTGCPLGEFGCACDNGLCAAGLVCTNGVCELPPGDGDGDTGTTGDGDGDDPWDPDPMTCVDPSIPITVTDIEGSACSAPCVANADCPPGPVGTTPSCVLVLEGMMDPDHCALVCDPVNDTCSPGASCKDVPNQPGIGVCTYP